MTDLCNPAFGILGDPTTYGNISADGKTAFITFPNGHILRTTPAFAGKHWPAIAAGLARTAYSTPEGYCGSCKGTGCKCCGDTGWIGSQATPSPQPEGAAEAGERASETAAPDGWVLHADGKPVSLAACPPGPFLFNGYLGFKSEYGAMTTVGPTNVPGSEIRWTVSNRPDAYCMDSGERFWGGAKSSDEIAALIVQPLAASPASPQASPTAASGETSSEARARYLLATIASRNGTKSDKIIKGEVVQLNSDYCVAAVEAALNEAADQRRLLNARIDMLTQEVRAASQMGDAK